MEVVSKRHLLADTRTHLHRPVALNTLNNHHKSAVGTPRLTSSPVCASKRRKGSSAALRTSRPATARITQLECAQAQSIHAVGADALDASAQRERRQHAEYCGLFRGSADGRSPRTLSTSVGSTVSAFYAVADAILATA
jgi:hypothetical protein